MESGKLDIDSEVKTPKEPVATYKPIPEDDSVLAVRELAKEDIKMAKHDGDTDTDDGAQELMLKNIGKITSNKDASEVKFISENGDAKIDIETVKQTLTGMTKEELMKYANDPFWIRLRWVMFITFWLLWAAMLAGAIAIIVMAPKCTPPEPKKLWQKSPIVRLNPLTMGNSLKKLGPTLDHLKNNNIKVISLGSIFTSSNGYTKDFRSIQPELGKIEDLKALVEAARKHEQEIILEVDPNYTSDEHPWFNYSKSRIEPYTNYYVWADGKKEDGERPVPPTNWLSVHNGSAWEWDEQRKQYYLHQFNKTQPDLNYQNPAVIKEFSNILTHWMNLGITGFRLANTQYLLENLLAGDESPSIVPSPPETYQSLLHVHTYDLTNNTHILQEWRNVISNYTKNNGLFALREDINNDMLEVLKDNSTVDLPQKSSFLFTADASITAAGIQAGVSGSLPFIKTPENSNNKQKIKEPWPAWDLNNEQNPLDKRINQSIAESLTLMTLLLPGTPILSLAQTKYPGEALQILTKAREQPAFLHGDTTVNVTDGTVFLYTRLKSGSPGYLVAYQSGDVTATVDLTKFAKVPDEVTVIARSSNYVKADIPEQNRISSKTVRISPKSTIAVQFAPNAE